MNDRLDVKCSVRIQLNSGNTEPRKVETPGLLRLGQLKQYIEALKGRNEHVRLVRQTQK